MKDQSTASLHETSDSIVAPTPLPRAALGLPDLEQAKKPS